jgi:hypothetical protein
MIRENKEQGVEEARVEEFIKNHQRVFYTTGRDQGKVVLYQNGKVIDEFTIKN